MINNTPLTSEMIKAAFEELESKRKESEKEFMGIKIIESPCLTGMQTIIKSGNNVYFSPDITSGEVKIITFPEMEPITFEPPKIEYFGKEYNLSEIDFKISGR